MKPAEKPANPPSDDSSVRPRKGLQTLDDLENEAIPTLTTAFNTCTRSGRERRQLEDRRGQIRPNCEQRRSGRDRRMMTYY